ncbi:MAG: hypothetical protein K0Q87_4021 [Neobacillus sp.]|nr:hypothetical protein [Neobacillus sp.]
MDVLQQLNALIGGSIYKKEAIPGEVAYYLIVEKKLKYLNLIFQGVKNIDGGIRKEYFPVELLRDWVSDLDLE